MNSPNLNNIVLISSDEHLLKKIEKSFIDSEIDIVFAGNISEALKAIELSYPGMIILSADPNIPPSVFIRKVRTGYPSCDIVGIDIKSEPEGLSLNISSDDGQELINFHLNKILNDKKALRQCSLIGISHSIKEVANSILSSASTNLSVLITGASGTGKELAAKAIHHNSNRSNKPFLSINCGALTEGVLTSELFGHERGAFTGAVSRKKGVFETAGDGTIFLDEIGEISTDTQVKLLRVLEDGSFYRVGGSSMMKSNARVIAATNRDLLSEVSNRNFRQDLYYRLRVLEIFIPSLKERPEDIPVLTEWFIEENGGNYKKTISSDILDILIRHDWPGNGRELRNFIESRMALSGDRIISREDIEDYIRDIGYQRRNLPVTTGLTPEAAEHQLIIQAIYSLKEEISSLRNLITDNLPSSDNLTSREREINAEWSNIQVRNGRDGIIKSVSEVERETILSALEKFGGNRRKTAKALGIGERTLYRKIAKYNLQ
ncbi:MAG: sigma-54-dependent Fis family transcriptional regulator [candidate division Zixibacteria bacterium]|nr:sigma-54-dependent Fis family transcriptional regulator [candidate division Zixibacteria bacterium]